MRSAADMDRIDTRRGRLRRELAFYAGHLAIACNLFAMLLLALQPQGLRANPFDPLAEPQVICTLAGTLVLDRDGDGSADSPGGSHTPHCVLCLPLMQAATPGPVPDYARLETTVTAIASQATDQRVWAAVLVDGSSARGPPAA